MNRLFLFLVLASLLTALQVKANSLTDKKNGDTLQVAVYVHVNRAYYHGDSIPNVRLHEFYRYSPLTFKNKSERERYNRMVRNIKLVFPYAQLVRTTLIETYCSCRKRNKGTICPNSQKAVALTRKTACKVD